jgi:hypothetical protein
MTVLGSPFPDVEGITVGESFFPELSDFIPTSLAEPRRCSQSFCEFRNPPALHAANQRM